jgi:nitrite reductase/ring-hydroxylating ferredoxin subunit
MERLSEELPPPPWLSPVQRELSLPRRWRTLCQLSDLPDGAARGYPPAPGGFVGLVAVRQGDAILVYVNSCPHLGTPLEWVPDRFLSVDGSHIVCATHGAEFRIADGECLRGPCFGERLEPVMIQIKDGTIFVPEDAGL